jgi:hypothetical protein
MSVREYVLQYFPDVYSKEFPDESWSIFLRKASSWIGEGDTEEQAWEDAKKWIDELPEDQKPKICQ